MNATLPKAIYSSELVICGVTLRCHVLDNGQRVFESGAMPTEEEAMQLARVVRLDHD